MTLNATYVPSVFAILLMYCQLLFVIQVGHENAIGKLALFERQISQDTLCKQVVGPIQPKMMVVRLSYDVLYMLNTKIYSSDMLSVP